jgi:hypothetical protein
MSIDIFAKLPNELKHHILKYSYKVQSKKLRQDITSYIVTYSNVYNIYYKILVGHFGEPVEEINPWLVKDIIATLQEYTPRFYEFWRRRAEFREKTDEYIRENFARVDNPRILWTMLKPEERILFLLYLIKT